MYKKFGVIYLIKINVSYLKIDFKNFDFFMWFYHIKKKYLNKFFFDYFSHNIFKNYI